VAYADELKSELVGVSPATLARHGAVSGETARELARGVRVRCGADHGIGVTGVAGPGGGTPEKPVGLVHVAWSRHDGEEARELRLRGDRAEIRERAVAHALDGLRRQLLVEAADGGDD
jgi:nicotinamide-nucleotide amidase